VRRREFIGLAAGVATWPIAARAQQAMPMIGYLHSGSPSPFAQLLTAFRRGLSELGFIEGRNVAIEYRWAEGHYEQLPSLANDLVHRQVTVIASSGGSASVLAAKAATAVIPIVFTSGGDPIALGIVASLNRPEANLTGVNVFASVMEGKRLGLLHELVPSAASIGVLLNPSNPPNETQSKDVQKAAIAIGRRIQVFYANSERDLDAAFTTFAKLKIGALLVASDPFFNGQRDRFVALAASHRIPAIYEQREYAVAGGLMSYGTNLADAYWQAGIYTARILKGEKPSDLPVVQPTKFEFVINLKTAKALGLTVPDKLLALADEVIE
jgi:putative tryptophan/tyrosine transport system substrate-binding protein